MATKTRSLLKILKQYPIFSQTDEDSLKDVTMAYMADESFAIFVKSDGVYGVGSPSAEYHSYLGLHTKIKKLTDVTDIIDMAIGIGSGRGTHLLLLKVTGEIIGLGHNTYGCLGDSTTTNTDSGQFVCCKLLEGDERAMKIKCGGYFSMVLTTNGNVYCCGKNDLGQCGQSSSDRVSKMNSISNLHRVKKISCGYNHCMALNEDGKLFAWGGNECGQLGLGDLNSRTAPDRVQLNHVTQVICGNEHTLSHTETGFYTWGRNNEGQLGCGNSENSSTPMAILLQDLVEIAAHFRLNISVARTTSIIYSWGGEEKVRIPQITKATTMKDVFLKYGVTWKPLAAPTDREVEVDEDHPSLVKSLSHAFNNSERSDMKFLVKEKIIHANKFMLTMRCQYFQTMFASDCKESESSEVKISDYSYEVYEAFLKYLYTDRLDITAEIAMDMYDLANCYEEQHLKKLLERIIQKGITVENAAIVYEMAQKYDCERLQQDSVDFAMKRLNAVHLSEGFQRIDAEVARSFTYQVAKQHGFRS